MSDDKKFHYAEPGDYLVCIMLIPGYGFESVYLTEKFEDAKKTKERLHKRPDVKEVIITEVKETSKNMEIQYKYDETRFAQLGDYLVIGLDKDKNGYEVLYKTKDKEKALEMRSKITGDDNILQGIVTKVEGEEYTND